MRGYYDRAKIVVNLGCYFPCHILVSSFIQLDVGDGVKGGDRGNRYFSPLQVLFY